MFYGWRMQKLGSDVGRITRPQCGDPTRSGLSVSSCILLPHGSEVAAQETFDYIQPHHHLYHRHHLRRRHPTSNTPGSSALTYPPFQRVQRSGRFGRLRRVTGTSLTSATPPTVFSESVAVSITRAARRQ